MSGGTNGKRAALVGYLERVTIENIRSIVSLEWEVLPSPGWNVVLGDNGSGKSTFLRAVAATFLDGLDRSSLRTDFFGWVRRDSLEGRIHLAMRTSGAPLQGEMNAEFIIEPEVRSTGSSHEGHVASVFSAGFGPFRRFTGGDAEYEKQLAALPHVARHLSLFDERVSLNESLAWLQLLRFKELEADQASATLLAAIRTFVNQDGFLPGGTHLDRITSDAVLFNDANDTEVPVNELSDGFRSILSLTFELIRHLASHYGADHVFDTSSTAVIAPGVVLIDEVDAHLHPTWQRQIGRFLRKCFPAIQFVVTTHSPIICQAADTVLRLPRPGTDEKGHMVTGAELDILRYGNLAEAYETEAIGLFGRSVEAQALLDRLGVLNRKEIDAGLTEEESKEQRRLQEIFPAALERRA